MWTAALSKGTTGVMTNMRLGPERAAASFAIVLSIAYWAFTAISILRFPPEYRVQFVPDDAYYYLTLARNFVTQGQWTFDSGISLTTGFHPLHAYALAALYALAHPSAENFVSAVLVMSLAPALIAMGVGVVFVARSGRLLPALVLLLFCLSRNICLNTVSGMEWCWVVLISTLYVFSFRLLGSRRTAAHCASLVALGFLGSLSRTDFGLLPAAFVAAALLTVRTQRGKARFFGALSGLFASALGIAVVMLHNAVLTGQYLQSSARMKTLWLDTYGPSIRPIYVVILGLFEDETGRMRVFVYVLLVAAIVGGAIRFFKPQLAVPSRTESRREIRGEWSDATIWIGSLIAIVTYMCFYSFNPASIQLWYTACIVVPMFMAVSLPFTGTKSHRAVNLAAIMVTMTLIVTQLPSAYRLLGQPEWPHQLSMFRAGHFLANHALGGRVGSWNAGIIGYYEGGHVVNLDGLVNNDIYEYARRNDLPRYVDENHIRFIVDFKYMLSNEMRKKRGGYSSPTFLDRLEILGSFDDCPPGRPGCGLSLYEVRAPEDDVLEPGR